MSTSLNIAGKLDGFTLEIFERIHETLSGLGIPYLVVGATARDLILHHGYGAPIQRATRDIDFAVEVPNWALHETAKRRLIEQGFGITREAQRLSTPNGGTIDIVPFGPIQDGQAKIAWPPDSGLEMSVLGFREALDHAEHVTVRDDPRLDIPVATPIGLILMKLIAWVDRPPERRRSDAQDIAYLLANYENIPQVIDALYDETTFMERYDWNQTLAAACLLGSQASRSTYPQTWTAIAQTLRNDNLTTRLVDDMSREASALRTKNEALLSAFAEGFLLNLPPK